MAISMWDKFSIFLFVDRKMSDKRSSLGALKSRYKILSNYFSDKDFSRDNFNSFVHDLKSHGYSTSYMNNFIKLGKLIDKFQNTDILKDYTYFYEKQMQIDVLTPDEVKRIAYVDLAYSRCSEALNYRDSVLIEFLFATGVRKGEMRDLTWENIRNAPIPHIHLLDTKNGEDHNVTITQRMYEMLQSLPRRSEYVFTTYRGGQMSDTELNIMLKKRAEACQIYKQVYPHIFRHSCGTNLWRMGFSQDQIAKFLNHKDINTTTRYVHSELDDLAPLAYANPLEPQQSSLTYLVEIGYKLLAKIFDKHRYQVQLIVTPVDSN